MKNELEVNMSDNFKKATKNTLSEFIALILSKIALLSHIFISILFDELLTFILV